MPGQQITEAVRGQMLIEASPSTLTRTD